MSTRYGHAFSPNDAIDGIYLPSQHHVNEGFSLALTLQELSPWIQVDMESSHLVYGVKIWWRSENTYQSESTALIVTHFNQCSKYSCL